MDEPVRPTPPRPGAPGDPAGGPDRSPGSPPSPAPDAGTEPGSRPSQDPPAADAAAGVRRPPAEPPPSSAVRPAPAVPSTRARRRRRFSIAAAAAAALVVAAVLGALAADGGWYEAQLRSTAPASPGSAASPPGAVAVAAGRPPDDPGAAAATISSAVARAALAAGSPHGVLAASFPDLAPRGVYLVVDTYGNRLRVYRAGELLREAVCSTGSGTVLKDPVGGRTWVFDTPLGERRVQRKTRNPVWIKPDWAFVEDGYAPPDDFRLRVDDVSLGRYGLYLGDGYIIHGTLFQTLLGRPLTHGCIRLGNEDLEYVYRQVPLGARVFLY